MLWLPQKQYNTQKGFKKPFCVYFLVTLGFRRPNKLVDKPLLFNYGKGVGSMLSKKIAIRIKELRLQKNMTQEALAELAGLDLSYLGKIERGQIENIKIEPLDKIIKGLNIDYPSFFSFEKDDNDISEIIHDITSLNKREDIIRVFKQIILLSKNE